MANQIWKKGYINSYDYIPNPALKYLKFEKMTDEWLDFIAACRTGKSHTYDIVEGPMLMIRSLIMYRLLWTERYPELHSGSLLNLIIRRIRLAFTRFLR